MKLVPSIILLLMTVTECTGQGKLSDINCTDKHLVQTITGIQKQYSSEGYELVKEAALSMESGYEIPVIVPLNEGTTYKIVFIGDTTSRLYEIRMYDWNEKQVIFRQNKWGDIDGNIIGFNYTPKFSEYHMIKPLQINKTKKKLCGYIILFKYNPV